MSDMTTPLQLSSLYKDPDTGKTITTHSMIKTFRRCPKQAEYKYVRRLKPRVTDKPLYHGTWMHKLLETKAKGGDWRETHKYLAGQFSKLFDEEKEKLGDLPRNCARIMRSYEWHYADDPWKVLEVEFTLEVELPDGSIYRCRLDELVENQYGLWIVDHKNHRILPDLNFRLGDSQSALYVWAALKNGIPVQGHIWNYLRSRTPTWPEAVYKNTRLSKKSIETDYPTLLTAIKHYGFKPQDYLHWLKRLRSHRYRPGEMQMSPFFRRDVLEKSPRLLKQVASEAFATHTRMHSYHWDKVESIERVPDRSCTFSCSYLDICQAELFGGNTSSLMKKYKVGDPMDYYYDERPGDEKHA